MKIPRFGILAVFLLVGALTLSMSLTRTEVTPQGKHVVLSPHFTQASAGYEIPCHYCFCEGPVNECRTDDTRSCIVGDDGRCDVYVNGTVCP